MKTVFSMACIVCMIAAPALAAEDCRMYVGPQTESGEPSVFVIRGNERVYYAVEDMPLGRTDHICTADSCAGPEWGALQVNDGNLVFENQVWVGEKCNENTVAETN